MLFDLSHTIATGMMQVASLAPVEVCQVSFLTQGARTNSQSLRLSGHSGTHVDAPVHVIDGLASIDSFAPDRFVGPGVVLPLAKGARGSIDAADLEAASRGLVRAGDMVLLHTGWDAYYGQQAYLDDYPSLTLDAADWLLDHGVRLLGLDLLSPDLPPVRRAPDAQLVVHQRLLGNDVLIAENLTGLAPLAGRRVRVSALPIKVAAGDGAPARITAELAE
ncbi:MAG TPA: cyclase family protein [Chloroflexota bacterium]|nr:cyclase family protein [Chloroflexota bacterium]